jgi:hypothetical protein
VLLLWPAGLLTLKLAAAWLLLPLLLAGRPSACRLALAQNLLWHLQGEAAGSGHGR